MEIVFISTTIILASLIVYLNWQHGKERLEWTQSMIAKNEREFTSMRFTEKTKPEPLVPVIPDTINTDEMDDEQFLEYIRKNAELTTKE